MPDALRDDTSTLKAPVRGVPPKAVAVLGATSDSAMVKRLSSGGYRQGGSLRVAAGPESVAPGALMRADVKRKAKHS